MTGMKRIVAVEKTTQVAALARPSEARDRDHEFFTRETVPVRTN